MGHDHRSAPPHDGVTHSAQHTEAHDDDAFDYVIVGSGSGSGFGGSVAALRLAEKGYSVAMLECGRRYRDEDFPRAAGSCATPPGSRSSASRACGDRRSSRTWRSSAAPASAVAAFVYANTPYRARELGYFDGEGPERTGCNECGGAGRATLPDAVWAHLAAVAAAG